MGSQGDLVNDLRSTEVENNQFTQARLLFGSGSPLSDSDDEPEDSDRELYAGMLNWAEQYMGSWGHGFRAEEFHAAAAYIRSHSKFRTAVDERAASGHLRGYSFSVLNIKNNTTISSSWPDFISVLRNNPQQTVAVWSMAAHRVQSEILDSDPVELPRLDIGFINCEEKIRLVDIDDSLQGKFVTCVGRVLSTENVLPCPTIHHFSCAKCGTTFSVPQPVGHYFEPSTCKGTKNCKGVKFTLLYSHPGTTFVDSRPLDIQDIGDEGNSESVCATIRCITTGVNVDGFRDSDTVLFSGIVQSTRMKQKAKVFHRVYIRIISIHPRRSQQRGLGALTEKDKKYFGTLSKKENIISLLVQSFLPNFTGGPIVKAGVLLSLFTGQVDDNGAEGEVRKNMNVLLVGGTATQKTKLLKEVCSISSRSEFVNGKNCTAAGLSVSLQRQGNNFILRSGSVVRASGGVLCLDEMDKMKTDVLNVLLEPMEQQKVSLSKAAVTTQLPALTCVIGACCPKGNRYDNRLTFGRNVGLPAPLLNRFDLIFTISDCPDVQNDKLLAQSSLQRMPGFQRTTASLSVCSPSSPMTGLHPSFQNLPADVKKVVQELYQPVGELLSKQQLSSYIALCKSNCFPKLERATQNFIVSAYIRIKQETRSKDRLINTRQLETLWRMTKGIARMCMCESATVRHARYAVGIYRYALLTTLTSYETTGTQQQAEPQQSSSGSSCSGATPRPGTSKVKPKTTRIPTKPAILTAEAEKVIKQLEMYKQKKGQVIQRSYLIFILENMSLKASTGEILNKLLTDKVINDGNVYTELIIK